VARAAEDFGDCLAALNLFRRSCYFQFRRRALRAYTLNSPTITITLVKLVAVNNTAARPVPPHLLKGFFARQARRPDQASSVATIINIAKPSNSSMVHPHSRFEQNRTGKDHAAVTRARHGSAVEETYGWKTTKRFRYRLVELRLQR
jgi:hypothetical protein